MDLKKLLIRSVSGIVYVALIVVCTIVGNYAVLALAALLGVLATVEFSNITRDFSSRNVPLIILDCIGCVCLVLSGLIFPLVVWFAVVLMRLILQLYVSSDKPIRDMAYSLMSQIYIGLPMALMVWLSDMYSSMTLLAVFIMIWLNDTGAYLFGCTFGRHRLFERISPRKSWEGFFGGLLLTVAGGFAASFFFSGFFNIYGLWKWIGMAVVVTCFATWGDLVESLIKRSLSIKDSGRIIPGHGGILDRIDSMLFVVPAVFVYFLLVDLDYMASLI